MPSAAHLCKVMRRILVYALLPALLFGCAEGAKKVERPADVLPPDKMVRLLSRIHLAETRLQVRRIPNDSAKRIFDRWWDSTARAEHTDTAAFSRSYTWYANAVVELDSVYSAVTDSLGVEESRAAGRATPKRAAQTAPAPGRDGRIAIPADTNQPPAAPAHH